MVIGAILSLAVTRKNPVELTKSFFDGMGDAYANIIGIIISVGVFVAGLNALGLIKALINWMLNSTGIVKIAATFGRLCWHLFPVPVTLQLLRLTKQLLRMRHSLVWKP